MTILDLIQDTDLGVPMVDTTETGKIYRQALAKVTAIKIVYDKLPAWKRLILNICLRLQRVLLPDPVEYTEEIPVTEDMYLFVKFLREECGYSFPHAVIIAASTCGSCIDYINLELREDFASLYAMSSYDALDPDCPICKLRKKAFLISHNRSGGAYETTSALQQNQK